MEIGRISYLLPEHWTAAYLDRRMANNRK